MEAADGEAAQTETLKKLCAKDKCDIDPKAIFDTSSCPGTSMYVTEKILLKYHYISLAGGQENEFLLWLVYSCDGEGATDASTFDLEIGKSS